MTDDMALANLEPARRFGAAMHDVTASKRAWTRTNRRPSAFSAREGLIVLELESMVVLVAARSLVAGNQLSDVDRERLSVAVGRIAAIQAEVSGQ